MSTTLETDTRASPFVSLYHWDLPLELMEHGGWLIRETAERIADYAELAASRAGRPGDGMDHAGRTVAARAARSRPPISPTPCCAAAIRTRFLRMPGVANDVISDGDLAVISSPLDFNGVSFYHPTVVAAAHGNSSVPSTLEDIPGVPHTDSRWPVQPAPLTRLLMDHTADHPPLPPLYVAANSCAYQDVENQIGGSVIDAKRTDDAGGSPAWTVIWPRSPMPWDQ